jgi:hypothetical protein
MKVLFDAVGVLGLIGLGLGAACWFAPQDNTDNVAMAHFIALPFLGLGALLFIVALIGRLA